MPRNPIRGLSWAVCWSAVSTKVHGEGAQIVVRLFGGDPTENDGIGRSELEFWVKGHVQ
jgi:hypothetical protein